MKRDFGNDLGEVCSAEDAEPSRIRDFGGYAEGPHRREGREVVSKGKSRRPNIGKIGPLSGSFIGLR